MARDSLAWSQRYEVHDPDESREMSILTGWRLCCERFSQEPPSVTGLVEQDSMDGKAMEFGARR